MLLAGLPEGFGLCITYQNWLESPKQGRGPR
jgi:hypothetical protein